MKTRLTQLLGITHPILQGAMASVSERKLVSAVSNAGGAGIIAAGGCSSEWLAEEIWHTKKLTDKPFGVNVPLLNPSAPEMINNICMEKVDFVTLGAGNPVTFIDKLHKAGIKVISIVPNVKLAKRVEAAGADAVIIEGMEAGGHIGDLTTMALLSNVVPEVSIPVIAAGGIVDGRGLAAALVMGSSGVQIGSRFLLTKECIVHPRVQEMIISANDTDSIVTGHYSSEKCRCIRNKFTDHYIEQQKAGATKEELDKITRGTRDMAVIDGDIVNGQVNVGQSLTQLKRIQSVADVIREIMDEAVEVIRAAPNFL